MKNILLIQARLESKRADMEYGAFQRILGEGVHVERVSVLDDSYTWDLPGKVIDMYDGVIIGGSGDFHLHGGNPDDDACREARRFLERLRPYIIYMHANDTPVLGVCFGHQLIAEIMDGGVTNDRAQQKTGTYEITLTTEGARDPLFGNFPTTFSVQYAHKDSVTSLPTGATLLASGDTCRFSALRYGSRMYTVQFHPELSREDMVATGRLMPQYLPEGAVLEDMFRPSPEASKVISIFIESIAHKKNEAVR